MASRAKVDRLKKKTRKARAEGEADFKPVYVYNNKLLVMHVL